MDDIRRKYLTSLQRKASETLRQDYHLVEKFGFDSFELINAYLIQRAVENQFNVLFQIPEQGLRKEYHLPTLIMLSLLAFYKNYTLNEYEVKVGDVLLGKKGMTRKITRIINGEFHWQSMDDNNSHGSISERAIKKYPILTTNNRQRKLKTNLRTYQTFFDSLLGCGEEVPYRFRYKFIIVARKQVTDSLKKFMLEGKKMYKAFPFEYVWERRDGTHGKEANLPIEPMVYIVNDFAFARKYLLNKPEIEIDNVLFIGSSKYKDEAPNISNALNRKLFKSCICVGRSDFDGIPDLYKWQWQMSEYHFLNGTEKRELQPIKVESPVFDIGLERCYQHIKLLEEQFERVKLDALYDFFFRAKNIVCPSPESRIVETLNKLKIRFEKEAKDIVMDAFFDAGHYNEVAENWKILQQQFNKLIDEIQQDNSKAKALHEVQPFDFLVVPKNHVSIWKNYVPRQKYSFPKVIDYSEFKQLKTPTAKHIVFLGFFGRRHLQAMLNSHHRIQILLYSEERKLLESQMLQLEKEMLREVKSAWRQQLSGITLKEYLPEENLPDFLERLAQQKALFQTSEIRMSEGGYTPAFEIQLEDGETIKVFEHSNLVILNGQRYEMLTASLIRTGDKLLDYQNTAKEELFEIALKADKTQLFGKIEHCSDCWRNALLEHFRNQFQDVETYFESLQNAGLKITSLATFRNWISNNCSVKFPQSEGDLHTIRQVVNDTELNQKFEEITHTRRKYNSLMIALGKDFSGEVQDFLLTGKKGKLLKEFSEKQVRSIVERSAVFKKIIQINPI